MQSVVLAAVLELLFDLSTDLEPELWRDGDVPTIKEAVQIPPEQKTIRHMVKRDRLVDVATLASARDRIADWWARGYARAPSRPVNDRFVREAVATLSVDRPGDDARLLDEIYAGVEWQRMRLRNDQRLDEWSGVAPPDA